MNDCSFSLCVYQEAGHCTLAGHNIDGLGMCGEAIVVDIPQEILLPFKQAAKASLEQEGA